MLGRADNDLGPGSFVEVLLQILRYQLFPPHGAMIIHPRTTVCLVTSVPLMQHCLNCLLSLLHCVSVDIIDVSHFLSFPPYK